MILKSFIKKYARVIISVTLIVILIYKFDFTEALSILSKSNLIWVLAILISMSFNVLLSSWRLKYILGIFYLDKSIWYLSKLYLVGNFYNNFLPTQMGGDVYKAYRLSKDLQKSGEGTFTVFMDRFSGLVILLVVSFIGFFIQFGIKGIALGLVISIIGIFSYSFILKFFAKKISLISKFKKANDMFLKNKSSAVQVFLTAIGVQVFAISAQLFAFYALGVDIPILDALLYLPIITLLGLIPSINGLGIQDSGYIFFFGTIGIIEEQAFAASILYHVLRFGFSLIGGLLILIENNSNTKEEKKI